MSTLFQNRKDRTLYVHDGAANFIVGYVFQIILQFLFSIVVIATMTAEEKQGFSGTFAYVLILCILNESAFALTPFSYSKVLGQNYYKDMGFKTKLSFTQIIMLIAIAIAVVVAFLPVANWVAQLFIKAGYDVSSITTLTVTNPGQLVLAIIFLAMLPAFCEEVLFRGMIARAFSRKSYVFAIFMGAFMFAIMHGNPVQFVHQFMIGLVCCVVYFATGSIYASIIIHFTNNLISVVGSYVLYLNPVDIPTYVYILMVVFGTLILAALLYFFVVMINKDASIKGGLKSINAVFGKTFRNNRPDLAKEDLNKEIDSKVQESGLEEMKEVYAQEVELRSQDEKLKARRGMIFALVLAIAMFVINTVLGFVG